MFGLAADELEGVGEDGFNGGEVFADGFFGAGEVDDEGALGDTGEAAAEGGHGGVGEAGGAHQFGDARGFAIDDAAGGFRGVVARTKSGAAGGEDEVEAVGDPAAEGCFDGFGVVGDDGGAVGGDVEGGEAFADCWARCVDAFAASACIGESEDAGAVVFACLIGVHGIAFAAIAL